MGQLSSLSADDEREARDDESVRRHQMEEEQLALQLKS